MDGCLAIYVGGGEGAIYQLNKLPTYLSFSSLLPLAGEVVCVASYSFLFTFRVVVLFLL